ncbi:MAG: MerR family transcriptional regulator [Pseudomonadota bacterium]
MIAIGIGTLAKRVGVSIDTIRYYEKTGLLSAKTRLQSGYRRYSEVEVTRLRFIRRAQALGFTLKEVKDLLTLSSQRNVSRVRLSAEKKLSDVDARIVELQRIRSGLSALISACPGHGRAADCPILNALGGETLEH